MPELHEDYEPSETVKKLSDIASLDGEKRKIVPFFAVHLEDMTFVSDHYKQLMGYPGVLQRIVQLARLGYAVTYMEEDDVAASMGLVQHWEGVMEAWVVISKRIRQNPLHFHRAAMAFLHQYAHKTDTHRVQAAVNLERRRAVSWATRMGFDAEGTLHNYGPNKDDFLMMAKHFDTEGGTDE